MTEAAAPAGVPLASTGGFAPSAFHLRLENFEGPFDLLLALISKRQLDVTQVALSQVTDEFISFIKAAGDSWDLGQATEFLVVASTLLDMKVAALLPSAEVENDEDLALLEARDLLFARVLQYRAYKLAAAHLQGLEQVQSRRFSRGGELEPRFADLLPDVLIGVSPQRLADLAAAAMTPKAPQQVAIEHIHAPRVSVVEHMAVLRRRLRERGATTFRRLIDDCTSTLEVVARFLGLLELYREGVVAFDQADALGELRVRWTGSDEDVSDQVSSDVERSDDAGSAIGGEHALDEDLNIDEEYG